MIMSDLCSPNYITKQPGKLHVFRVDGVETLHTDFLLFSAERPLLQDSVWHKVAHASVPSLTFCVPASVPKLIRFLLRVSPDCWAEAPGSRARVTQDCCSCQTRTSLNDTASSSSSTKSNQSAHTTCIPMRALRPLDL